QVDHAGEPGQVDEHAVGATQGVEGVAGTRGAHGQAALRRGPDRIGDLALVNRSHEMRRRTPRGTGPRAPAVPGCYVHSLSLSMCQEACAVTGCACAPALSGVATSRVQNRSTASAQPGMAWPNAARRSVLSVESRGRSPTKPQSAIRARVGFGMPRVFRSDPASAASTVSPTWYQLAEPVFATCTVPTRSGASTSR